jgi:hypothetical protein
MNLAKKNITDEKLRLIHRLFLIKIDICTYFDNILSSMTHTRIILRHSTFIFCYTIVFHNSKRYFYSVDQIHLRKNRL